MWDTLKKIFKNGLIFVKINAKTKKSYQLNQWMILQTKCIIIVCKKPVRKPVDIGLIRLVDFISLECNKLCFQFYQINDPTKSQISVSAKQIKRNPSSSFPAATSLTQLIPGYLTDSEPTVNQIGRFSMYSVYVLQVVRLCLCETHAAFVVTELTLYIYTYI